MKHWNNIRTAKSLLPLPLFIWWTTKLHYSQNLVRSGTDSPADQIMIFMVAMLSGKININKISCVVSMYRHLKWVIWVQSSLAFCGHLQYTVHCVVMQPNSTYSCSLLHTLIIIIVIIDSIFSAHIFRQSLLEDFRRVAPICQIFGFVMYSLACLCITDTFKWNKMAVIE